MRRAKALRSSFDPAIVNVKCCNTAHSPNKRRTEREQFTGNTDCTSIRFSQKQKCPRRDTQPSDKGTHFM